MQNSVFKKPCLVQRSCRTFFEYKLKEVYEHCMPIPYVVEY